ncbi:cysteine hydrolase family protein [Chloroflexota bacterium]
MGDVYEIGNWRELVPKGLGYFKDFKLEPKKTALLVIDMQRKIGDRKSARGLSKTLHKTEPELAELYFNRLEQVVVPNIQRLLKFFRERNLKIMHFVVGPALPSADDLPFVFKLTALRALAAEESGVIYKGTPEFEIVDSLKPEEGELVVHKVTMGGFTNTSADLLLRNMGIDGIVLVGGHTHGCLESTGRAGADLGFKVVVPEDATINILPLMHDAAMINFASHVGRVTTTKDLLAEMA